MKSLHPRRGALAAVLVAALAIGTTADDRTEQKHASMIATLKRHGIRSARVLDAMAKVRRHMYVPEALRDQCDAYGDHPCPIGYGQTISQPFVVAYMTEKMSIKKGEKVLEIGTGSGYQAAILAELGAEVYSIEIIPELAAHARRALDAEGYDGVHCKTGDGYQGWVEHSAFDVVIVTCAPDNVPPRLVEQLADGGRMIVPVGDVDQRLTILRKKDGKVAIEQDLPVRFVPMVRGKK